MASFSERISRAILGDPLEAGLLPKPIAYEDVHNDVQSILIPPMYPKGINVHYLQSIKKSFALQHRMGLEPGQLKQTMFGPMPGPGNRYYSVGAVVTHVSQQGGKYRVTAQGDVENVAGKVIGVGDVSGDGNVRVTVQAEHRRGAKGGPEWAVTSAFRGADSVTVVRAKDGPEFGLSYNSRLTNTSPVTLGGEVMVKGAPALSAARTLFKGLTAAGKKAGAETEGSDAAPKGKGSKPLPALREVADIAVGVAYDTGLHKTAVHVASTSTFAAVSSVHHLYRVTDRSTLAAKYMYNLVSGGTMAAVGYKMRFRNTMSTIHGMVDTYGTVRMMVEREPVKDVKIGLSFEGKLSPAAQASPGPDGPVILGLQVSAGTLPRLPQQQSPITMTRPIFGLT